MMIHSTQLLVGKIQRGKVGHAQAPVRERAGSNCRGCTGSSSPPDRGAGAERTGGRWRPRVPAARAGCPSVQVWISCELIVDNFSGQVRFEAQGMRLLSKYAPKFIQCP